MDLSEIRDALTLLIGVGFVLIALLAFIGFARPQLQKLAKNTIWQVPQMGLKGLIGLLLFVQLCMVFAESLSYPESKTAFLPYILGYVVVCPILTKLIHVALKQPAATNRYVATAYAVDPTSRHRWRERARTQQLHRTTYHAVDLIRRPHHRRGLRSPRHVEHGRGVYDVAVAGVRSGTRADDRAERDGGVYHFAVNAQADRSRRRGANFGGRCQEQHFPGTNR